MRTTLIVDGYNAINAIGSTRKMIIRGDLRNARHEMMRIAGEFRRSSGYIDSVCVVFDGDDRYRHMDRLSDLPGDHVFSGTDEGDDEIIRNVKKYSSFSRVIVVSNDNYVRNMSRGYGASLMTPEELAPEKHDDGNKKANESKKQLDKKTRDSITEDYLKELGLE